MRAILLLVAGVSLFAVIDGLGKLLAEDLDVVQVIWARYAFSLPLLLWLARGRLATLARVERPLFQIGRALLPLLAGICVVLALRAMPLADVTAILFVAPLMVTPLSIPLLGERVGLHRWTAVLVGFIGVLIIVRPGGEGMQWAALLPLACAFFFALYQIATRLLSHSTDPIATFGWTIGVGFVAATLALPFVWRTPTPELWALMALSGILHGLGHYCIIRAFDRTDASALAPFGYTQLLAATLFGFLVFDHVPDLPTVVGALIIVAAGLYTAWRERLQSVGGIAPTPILPRAARGGGRDPRRQPREGGGAAG